MRISVRRVTKLCETYEFLVLAAVVYADVWFASLVKNLEREVLDIGLNFIVIEFATNESLCIEDTGRGLSVRPGKRKIKNIRIYRVHSDLILCGIADQSLVVGE